MYETPRSRFLADFIGDANLVDGELVVNARHFVCRRGITAPVRADGMAAGPATLAVRPQRLRPSTRRVPPGVVKRASYLGSRIEYVVVTARESRLRREAHCAAAKMRRRVRSRRGDRAQR